MVLHRNLKSMATLDRLDIRKADGILDDGDDEVEKALGGLLQTESERDTVTSDREGAVVISILVRKEQLGHLGTAPQIRGVQGAVSCARQVGEHNDIFEQLSTEHPI